MLQPLVKMLPTSQTHLEGICRTKKSLGLQNFTGLHQLDQLDFFESPGLSICSFFLLETQFDFRMIPKLHVISILYS